MFWILTAFASPPTNGVDLQLVLDTLPACVRSAPPKFAGLDLEAGCLQGSACVGGSVEKVNEVFGTPTCKREGRHCSWNDGLVTAHVRGNQQKVDALFVKDPKYRTFDGIQVGASASCVVAGKATDVHRIEFDVENGRMVVATLWLRIPNVSLRLAPDGTIQSFGLFPATLAPPRIHDEMER